MTPVKKPRFETLYDPCSAFGGHEYHATTNGETVHIKHKAPHSNTFRIKHRMTKDAWDTFAEKHGLDDRNRNNPAIIASLCEQDDYN